MDTKLFPQFPIKLLQHINFTIYMLQQHNLMVKDKNLGGVQLLADNDWNSDFVKAFGVKSIPRFILINPNGVVVKSVADRPSDPELEKQLESLLN